MSSMFSDRKQFFSQQVMQMSMLHHALSCRYRQGTQSTIGSILFCFWKSKQMICLLEGWIRQITGSKWKQMYFIPETTKLIFGGLNINNKYCSTFTFMYLGYRVQTFPSLYVLCCINNHLLFLSLLIQFQTTKNLLNSVSLPVCHKAVS